MTIIISPYSKIRPNGKPSAKNYPYWKEVVEALRAQGAKVIQIGVVGEQPIGADEFLTNLPLREIKKLILECDMWLSVDNFFQHLAWTLGKKGIAIFGPSDPNIFGHSENVNLLKSLNSLRQKQFFVWHEDELNPDIFMKPEVVLEAIEEFQNS